MQPEDKIINKMVTRKWLTGNIVDSQKHTVLHKYHVKFVAR